MIGAYLATMFAVVLLDIFDKLVARYGFHVKEGDCNWIIPDRAIVFGTIECIEIGVRRQLRFLFVKIPVVKTWGYIQGRHPAAPYAFGWRSHRLQWMEGNNPFCGGWRIEPPLEG